MTAPKKASKSYAQIYVKEKTYILPRALIFDFKRLVFANTNLTERNRLRRFIRASDFYCEYNFDLENIIPH